MNEYVRGNVVKPDGQRCERLTAILPGLQQSDLDWLDPDRTKAHADALDCSRLVKASDSRLQYLVQSVQQASGDDGAAATQRLARTSAAITVFDHERSLSPEQEDQLAEGARAAARIADSDRHLAAFSSAGAGFSLASPPSAYSTLVTAAQAVSPFDRGRMSEQELALLDQARAAGDRLRESDARLQELQSALAIARTSNEAQLRERLIAAVAQVTEFDSGRAEASFGKDVTEARGLARRYALDSLSSAAADFDAATTTPETVAKLAAMRIALGAVADDEASPEQRGALKAADRASVMLADSDRRLAALLAAAAAWDKDPSPATAPQALSALAAIMPFDRARFDRQHRQAIMTLEAARQVIELKEHGGAVTLAALKELPLFVTGSSGEGGTDYVRLFQDKLRANGFRLASGREGSALAVELTGTVLGRQRLQGLATSLVDLALNAVWIYDGSGFRQDKQSANGSGGSEKMAVDEAYRGAVERLYQNLIGSLQIPIQAKQ